MDTKDSPLLNILAKYQLRCPLNLRLRYSGRSQAVPLGGVDGSLSTESREGAGLGGGSLLFMTVLCKLVRVPGVRAYIGL